MQQRRGFTLIEMLVSMALVIFIMVILSEAFVTGLETFRQLKALGDMEERLRGVTTVLRNDLAADHFDGRRRLSDVDFWVQGPPRDGYVRIWSGSTRTLEGRDGDNLPSFRAVNDVLQYTVRRRGNRREDFFKGSILVHINPMLPGEDVLNGQTSFFEVDQPAATRYQDPGTYTSQWTENAVFLRPNGSTTQGFVGGAVPLHGLYRRAQLLVTDNRRANWETPIKVTDNRTGAQPLVAYLASNAATFSEISCKKRNPSYNNNAYPDSLYFNNPSDLTIPQRRFGLTQMPLPTNLPGFAGNILPAGYPIRGAITRDAANGYEPDLRYPVFGDTEGPQQNPPLPLLTQDGYLQGADLLIDDVISFEVSVLVAGTTDFISLFDPYFNASLPARPSLRSNSTFYNPRVSSGADSGTNLGYPAVFDTWSRERNDLYDFSKWDPDASGVSDVSVPLKVRILALRIVIRVWDQKTQQTRQVTLIQDM